PSITDGKNSLLVLMTTNDKDQQHGFIQGTYTNQVTGAQSDAWLLIDLDSYQSSGLWASQSQSQSNHTVAEVFPKPGDTFEPSYLAPHKPATPHFSPSATPPPCDKAPFVVSNAPGPDGTSPFVLKAPDAAGTTAVDAGTISVKNAGLDPSLQGFKDL